MCETIAFEMCLESSKQPEVRHHQIWAVGRVWNNSNPMLSIAAEVAAQVVLC